MNKIDREKKTVCLLIRLYCRHKLKEKDMPDEYLQLADYACRRLDRCKFGEKKTTCRKCPVHCYAPAQREKIRAVMRWSGPRMLFYAPIEAIRHMIDK